MSAKNQKCWKNESTWVSQKRSCVKNTLVVNERTFTGLVGARHVNHTPADLGGVTSFLYELEHCHKYSFLDGFNKN